MKETCKNCEYYLDKFLVKDQFGLEVKTVHETDRGKLEMVHLNPWHNNAKDTGICCNEFSDFFEHCVTSSNTCDYFSSKNKAVKNNSKKSEKHGLSVFDNYTCDGQLVMSFSGDKIEFIEE